MEEAVEATEAAAEEATKVGTDEATEAEAEEATTEAYQILPHPKDYYNVLGVPKKTSDTNQINGAFYHLICKWYPTDQNW